MLTSTSQLTFSFFVNLATVLECIPLSFKYCLFFPLISSAFHNLSKIILPFVPYGSLFILIHFLSIFTIYDNRFCLFCQCLLSCSNLHNKNYDFIVYFCVYLHIAFSSTFVYYKYNNKTKAVAPTKANNRTNQKNIER